MKMEMLLTQYLLVIGSDNMYKLETLFSENNVKLLKTFENDLKIKILTEADFECYILLGKIKNNDTTTYRYDPKKLYQFAHCFGDYKYYYNSEEYEYYHCVPKHIISFYQFYLVETADFPGEWYRAEPERNGNLMLTVYDDTLEEAINNL